MQARVNNLGRTFSTGALHELSRCQRFDFYHGLCWVIKVVCLNWIDMRSVKIYMWEMCEMREHGSTNRRETQYEPQHFVLKLATGMGRSFTYTQIVLWKVC